MAPEQLAAGEGGAHPQEGAPPAGQGGRAQAGAQAYPIPNPNLNPSPNPSPNPNPSPSPNPNPSPNPSPNPNPNPKQERKERERDAKEKHRRLQELEGIAAEAKNKIAHQVRQRVEAERDAGFLLRNISRLEEHMSRKRHEERALAANLTEKEAKLAMASEVALPKP